MLSRTAENLFWMARYVERAENMARLMDMGRRMGGVPGGSNAKRNEWPSILSAAGCYDGFFAEHDEATPTACMRYLMLDTANSSSVVSCFEYARGTDIQDLSNPTLDLDAIDRGQLARREAVKALSEASERRGVCEG